MKTNSEMWDALNPEAQESILEFLDLKPVLFGRNKILDAIGYYENEDPRA